MADDEKCAWFPPAPPQRQQDLNATAPCHFACYLRLSASLLLLFGAVVRLPGQDDTRDLLIRVSQNVLDTVERLPKYVCTQTIDRDRYEPDHPRIAAFLRDRPRTCDEISA